MNLFENKAYALKDGRQITVKVEVAEDDGEDRRYGENDEYELSQEMLNVTAYLGQKAVGFGKFDVEENSFRGVEVFEEYRRLGVATAMYDELKRLGYHVRPSYDLEPDGKKFWAARRLNEEVQWSPDLIDTLQTWQRGNDFEGAFTDSRHGWQQQLIDFMARNPHHVDGILYRASRTSDETAEQIIAGEQAVHRKVGSLLESWSKTRDGALNYFDYQRDMHSIVVMAMPASSLKIVCDLDQVPFDLRVEEHEVLVLAEDRQLDTDNTIAALHYNYEEHIETEGFSPYTNLAVTRHRG